jgi:hypothetical protein
MFLLDFWIIKTKGITLVIVKNGQYCNIFSVGLLDFPWGTNFIVKIEISTSSASFLPFPWRLKWMTDAE